MLKLNAKALGLTLGMVWGSAMFLLGLINLKTTLGSSILLGMSSLYVGYAPTIMGSVIGGVWGFLDAGVAGVIVAWLYNKLAK